MSVNEDATLYMLYSYIYIFKENIFMHIGGKLTL